MKQTWFKRLLALALCVRIYKEYGTVDSHEIRRLHG